MSKLKTHSSLKKRIKQTASGKIKINFGYSRHNRLKKNSRSQKQNVGTKVASSTETKMFKKMRMGGL